jgi:spore coat polysaccharide biosynthesis protein SpsF (cytidylyltransferase family)
MNNNPNRKAVTAILSEYTNVIHALKRVIDSVSTSDLTTIVDAATDNPDCRSIQTILTHVVSSGYAYCNYIRKLRNEKQEVMKKVLKTSITEYENE